MGLQINIFNKRKSKKAQRTSYKASWKDEEELGSSPLLPTVLRLTVSSHCHCPNTATGLSRFRGLTSRAESDPASLSFISIWHQLHTWRGLVKPAFVTGKNLTGNPQAGNLWPLYHDEYKGWHGSWGITSAKTYFHH